uniref:Ion transport domain-containing protein n=1 Tax=Panagrolaimus superbus TaxID=310955 RepID=A0A914YA86_9BILA
MSKLGEPQDPKRHRTFNSRIISAPPRRKSVTGPGLPVLEDPNEDRLHRTLYRLPGDARGSVESMEKIYDDDDIVVDNVGDDDGDEQKAGSSNELHHLDPTDLERLYRRRASNIRMQNIIKTKILLPMSDVVRQPSLSESKRASFDSSAKSLATNAKESREGISNGGESIQLQNFGSTDQKPDEPLSASGRRFANIAKSITLLSGRSSRVGDSTSANPDAQEQNAFFNKYEQGLLVKDVPKIVKAYKKTYTAYFDFISVFPADYLLEAILPTPRPYLRFNRLIKLDRIQAFISATETRIAAPNAFRIFCVISYIVVLIHWNACIYFFVSNEIVGRDTDGWVYGTKNLQSLPNNSGVEDNLYRQYVYSFYWSMLILTTIGEVPGPVQNIEFAFVTLDLMCGVLIFATIVGNVGR